jgi:hypothetical protein
MEVSQHKQPFISFACSSDSHKDLVQRLKVLFSFWGQGDTAQDPFHDHIASFQDVVFNSNGLGRQGNLAIVLNEALIHCKTGFLYI